MDIHKYEVMAKLIMDKKFRVAMHKDVDKALKKYNFDCEKEFVSHLKKFGKSHGFNKIADMKVSDVNDALAKNLGLESRW